MLAFIRKKRKEDEWITGYCGSESEIILQFLNTGVRDLYQQAWMTTSGNAGDASQILNVLQSKGMAGTATRQDIEGIAYSLGGVDYQCIGRAETQEEAQELCAVLEAINEGNACASPYRMNQYSSFINAARGYNPERDEPEMRKILVAAGNLKL